jgi:hypothetical protein
METETASNRETAKNDNEICVLLVNYGPTILLKDLA